VYVIPFNPHGVFTQFFIPDICNILKFNKKISGTLIADNKMEVRYEKGLYTY